MDLSEINDYAQGINHIRLGTLKMVIPIGASTIVHTWLMYREVISDVMVSSQLSESLLMMIFE